jgi:hypothetical protein
MLDDLLEKYKDLNPKYVNNILEDYDNLVEYYSILHTKQQMGDYNVELHEWWELVEVQFKEQMYKNLTTHKKDEDRYTTHLFAFKKAFPNFMYINPDSLKPASPADESNKAKYSGITCQQ